VSSRRLTTIQDEELSGQPPDVSSESGQSGLSSLLTDSTDPLEFARTWLKMLCERMANVQRGFVQFRLADEDRGVVAYWPEPFSDGPLRALGERTVQEGRGVVQTRKASRTSDGPRVTRVAYPIQAEEEFVGAVVVETDAPSPSSIREAMRELQWGAAWVRLCVFDVARRAERRSLERTASALDIVAVALQERSFREACIALTTHLAHIAECDRVSLGCRRHGHARMVAMSHSAQFGRRMNTVNLLTRAMDEAIDQRSIVVVPAEEDDPVISVSHDELSRTHGSGTVLTIPLELRDRTIGAVTFERPRNRPFDPKITSLLESAVSLMGPVLEEKRLNDRWLVVKAGDAVLGQLVRLFGPGHLVRKFAFVCVIALVAFFYFAKESYSVTADASIEGFVRRTITATFDGFVKTAPVRAGDKVHRGQVLATLDDKDLALERLRWVTERQQKKFEYARALSSGKRTEVNIIRAQIEQADARIRLIDIYLSRSVLRAPFDGLVVSGDLSQSIGASVKRGDRLFEVAPLRGYRVILQVDESQIAEIEQGQMGRLLLLALPDREFDFVIDKITPVATTDEGSNVFRVEARLSGEPSRLRPGMKGVAKVAVDERRVIWIWTRDIIDRVRLVVWRWFP
jgi:RND family efflux transporter MFP subunit